MAFERSTSTPLDFDTAGGHERPSGAMPMDARQGIPGVRVNPDKSADSPPAAAAGGGLGNTAKSVRQTQSEIERVRHLQTHFGKTAAQEKREQRFKHQRAAARLLPSSRTAHCLWSVASNSSGVDVIHNEAEGRARYAGLQTCGSVWSCPVCSAKVSEIRRQELNDALAVARQKGLIPVLVSLTTRHKRGDSLASLLASLKKAKQRWANHRGFASLRSKNGGPLVGYITATEVTGGGVNGWHPHFHILMFFQCATEAEAIAKAETLQGPWLAGLKSEGLSGTGAAFDVQGGSAAGNYITKWGAAEEVALGGKKKGRGDGRAPFQLLADYADTDDKQAGALFAEYAKEFAGHRQLVWSPGLKALFCIEDIADAKAAEDEVRRADASKEDACVGHFTPIEWSRYRPQRAMILRMAELAGVMGVEAAVQAIRNLKAQTTGGMGGTPMSTVVQPVPGISPQCNPQGSQGTKV